MVSEKEIKYLKQIKQLEEENRLLKYRILSNKFKKYNIDTLKFKVDIKNLECEIDYWKNKTYYYKYLLTTK